VIGRLGERRAVQVGLGLMTLGFVGFALSPTAPLMYLSIVPFCLGAFAAPALKGIMSRHIPANSQGELQGAITSMASLTAIVSPPLMTQLFGYFSADAAPVRFPGAPFAAAALLLLLCLAWFQRSLQRARSPQQA
jgi:DHA1 family tetracycline resistance protein-like MFS transporter